MTITAYTAVCDCERSANASCLSNMRRLTIIIQQVSSLFLCTIILLLFCLRLLTPQRTHTYIRLKKALVLISHKPMPGHMQTCVSQTTQSAVLESKYMNRLIFEVILADLIFSSFIGWLINWTDSIYQAKCMNPLPSIQQLHSFTPVNRSAQLRVSLRVSPEPLPPHYTADGTDFSLFRFVFSFFRVWKTIKRNTIALINNSRKKKRS